MVKLKEAEHMQADGTIDLDAWISHIMQHRNPSDAKAFRNACTLSQLAGGDEYTLSGETCLQQGLHMAEILVDLNMDVESISAAILYHSVQYAELNYEDIAEHVGQRVADLVEGVEQMQAISTLHSGDIRPNKLKTDNLRKMLLAMIDDVRVVFIKLAERACLLRFAKNLPKSQAKLIADEVTEIYAPLANRLGIGQLKWELEDLAFRILHPDTYKEIASQLDSKRIDREKYVKAMVEKLEHLTHDMDVKGAIVTGRVKHIFSIYRKMQRKNVDFDQIFDVTAVRVLCDDIEGCYKVLSAVHSAWDHHPEEFDDYINSPKPNGYQSIHTAVVGPEDKNVEVQIRTFQMHEESELGVAAHWKYKEGAGTGADYEDKIALLRQVLDWQEELSESDETLQQAHKQIFSDRIYVFTPNGDIMDLPTGSTPLDFAYHVHSEVGNRCRGAKANGHIVPLTYQLQTGERVEILTAKQPSPSRDWLNPHSGYLKTSRAKAKVHHWFKQQDHDRNLSEGQHALDRELKRLNLKPVNYDKLAPQLNYKNRDDLLAALGGGDIRMAQIINPIQALQNVTEVEKPTISAVAKKIAAKGGSTDVTIQGVDNLLTSIARCCKPVPGDAIIGFITTGRGVTIHHENCNNVKQIRKETPDRVIDVSWGDNLKQAYPVDIYIYAEDRPGLLKDISLLLLAEKMNILGLQTTPSKAEEDAFVTLTVEITSLTTLKKILERLKQLPSVNDVLRQRTK